MAANEQFDLNAVGLSSTVTIGQFERMKKARDKEGLVNFIRQRLRERYISPLKAVPPSRKNGFLILAASCLLIETIEAFWRGWANTDKTIQYSSIPASCRPAHSPGHAIKRSRVAFCYFFERETAFTALRGHGYEFYDNVRCGILHAGETTGGWRVRRTGELFERAGLKINATRFLGGVQTALEGYSQLLRNADWSDDLWKNFRAKMDAIVRHCKPAS